MQYKIYTLTNPITGAIFYVGKSIQDLTFRRDCHCSELTNPRSTLSRKHEVILSLKKQMLKPVIEEIDSTDNYGEAIKLELYWIFQLKSWGFPITNREVNKRRKYTVIYTKKYPYGISVLKDGGNLISNRDPGEIKKAPERKPYMNDAIKRKLGI